MSTTVFLKSGRTNRDGGSGRAEFGQGLIQLVPHRGRRLQRLKGAQGFAARIASRERQPRGLWKAGDERLGQDDKPFRDREREGAQGLECPGFAAKLSAGTWITRPKDESHMPP